MRRRVASGVRFGVAVLACSCSLVATVGCVERSLTREQLVDRYVDGLVDAGIETSVARCVVERFVAAMSDAELRAFNLEGDSLNDAEQARIAELAEGCGA